jgi:hypothetical protein
MNGVHMRIEATHSSMNVSPLCINKDAAAGCGVFF